MLAKEESLFYQYQYFCSFVSFFLLLLYKSFEDQILASLLSRSLQQLFQVWYSFQQIF